jgi:putative redox protein
MRAEIRHIKGVTFIGKADTNHWVTVDGPAKFHGSEAACRPKELLLIALGSCIGSDVSSILTKKKINLDKFIVDVEGTEVEEHPKVFSKIHVTFHFYGENLKSTDLERAIELSHDKYCPITRMISKACPITHSYKMNDKEK